MHLPPDSRLLRSTCSRSKREEQPVFEIRTHEHGFSRGTPFAPRPSNASSEASETDELQPFAKPETMISFNKSLASSFIISALCTLTATTDTATAQTQLLRGSVDSIQGTNLFQIECTGIRVVSSTVNLQALNNASHQNDITFDLQVQQVDSNPTILDIVSATQTFETFEMGNLRFGRLETWEVFGAPGSVTSVFINLRSNTSYLPVGNAGTWLLGGNFGLLSTGIINAIGRYQFLFQMPTIPALVGTEISSQAIIVDPATGIPS